MNAQQPEVETIQISEVELAEKHMREAERLSTFGNNVNNEANTLALLAIAHVLISIDLQLEALTERQP